MPRVLKPCHVSRSDAVRSIAWSQAALFGSLAICTALMPRFLFSKNMGGISNYGVQPRTAPFYTVGVVAAALLLLKAARAAGPTTSPLVAKSCRLIAVLYLGDLGTTYPYKLNAALTLVHSWAAIILAITEMLMGVLLTVRLTRCTAGYSALTVQVLGFLLLGLTYFDVTRILFLAEITTAAAFGVLLILAAGASPAHSTELHASPDEGT